MISPEKILICRRDNIGDLVLTTPLIGAIVSAHPLARVDILVNSYTQEVIDPFPGVQHVYAYTKIKHAAGLANKWRAFKDRISLYWSLRQQKYDWLVLVDSARKQKNKLLAGAVRPRIVFALSDDLSHVKNGSNSNLALSNGLQGLPSEHECRRVLALLTAMPGQYVAEIPRLYVRPKGAEDLNASMSHPGTKRAPRLHVHLSARRVKQRWPIEYYRDLIAQLLQLYSPAEFVLTWAPGAAADRLHPGDDDLAKCLKKKLDEECNAAPRAQFCETTNLQELKNVLSKSTLSICPDGGAMHLAAGMGLPVIALFGDSPPNRWAPTSPNSVVLQAGTQHVRDLSVARVLDAVSLVMSSREML